MFNRLLILMFALLFVGQTISAAFDSHSGHQEINAAQSLSHRNLDKSHNAHQDGALAVASNVADNSEQDKFDCHHCCHCHAPSVAYITGNAKPSLLLKSNDNILASKSALLSLWITPEQRPPIV